MSRRKTIAAWGAGILALLISVAIVRTMSAAGQFTTIRPLGVSECETLVNIVGAEDAVAASVPGLAFVSSLDRNAVMSGRGDVRGEIYAIDMTLPRSSLAFKPATGGMPADFRPHGIAHYKADDGNDRVFVINHPSDGRHTVEIYRVEGMGLRHEETVDVTAAGSPNDLVAVGPRQFYVTDDGGGSAFSRFVDFAVQRTGGGVHYYDGSGLSRVADGFVMANGIALGPDGSDVYVADTLGRTLKFYSRDTTTGALTPTGSVFVGTGLDNITVDSDGALWIGAHPKIMDLAQYLSGSDSPSPSQVIRAVPSKTAAGGEMRTLLLDLGTTLSGSSVALRMDDDYLVGSILDARMLLCKVPQNSAG